MYSELKPRRILETIAALERRIEERFPGSGLGKVTAELARLARESEALSQKQRRPIWPLRLGAWIGITAILGITLAMSILGSQVPKQVDDVSDLVQGIESALNDVVLLGLAIFFLLTIEMRVKRRRALSALHRLRSIVHIVDMHQLTKDPEHLFSPSMATTSSPERRLDRFEMSRYLDYCSELLSLASKLAALHVQYLNDHVVMDAVNDIETLASSLSNKVWQKIMILDMMRPKEAAVAASPGAAGAALPGDTAAALPGGVGGAGEG